ncbi:MAG: HAD family phosphatase [Endomicrobium sp.]|jgi:putative hydrolase of the HAD superfamily|nr:HAD family phosphatase [Endomicrobium sp.]
MAVKIIVFDLGKVLFDFDLSKFAFAFSKKTPYKPYDINELLFEYANLAFSYEKGDLSSEEFFNIIAQKTHYSGSYNEFCVIWNNIFTPVAATIELAAKTASKYPVGLLSNTNELHINYLKERYPSVFMLFSKIHLSNEMRVRKPDDEIFKAVIKDYGVKPEEIFFTDDMEINVEAARKNAIKAYTFVSCAQLRQDLAAEGVI